MRLAHGPPDDVGLGQRRVEAAGLTEGALQPVGRAEHAALALDVGEHRLAGVGHVLAEHPDALVGRHLLVQRALDGLAQRHAIAAVVGGRRRREGQAGRRRSSVTDLGSGRRAASASAAALATISFASALSSAARSAVSTPPSTSSASRRTIGSSLASSASSSAGRYLRLGVGRRVRVGPGDVGVDQSRADAGTDVLDDRAPAATHLEVVGAVEAMDVEPAEAR